MSPSFVGASDNGKASNSERVGTMIHLEKDNSKITFEDKAWRFVYQSKSFGLNIDLEYFLKLIAVQFHDNLGCFSKRESFGGNRFGLTMNRASPSIHWPMRENSTESTE
jgi:hypothetical protein